MPVCYGTIEACEKEIFGALTAKSFRKIVSINMFPWKLSNKIGYQPAFYFVWFWNIKIDSEK